MRAENSNDRFYSRTVEQLDVRRQVIHGEFSFWREIAYPVLIVNLTAKYFVDEASI